MDHVIDYFFGTGSGPTTHWFSAPDADLDGDGTLDAVRLDFDGDGRLDDAMWDSDADGVADAAALDLDDDGVPDAFFTDGGRGLWEKATSGPGERPAPVPPPSPRPPDVSYDLDDDGTADTKATGIRRDGDALVAGRVYLDTDGDGRYDYVLIDRDGDGVADAGEKV